MHGLANPTLVPRDAVLLMASAFEITPDMAAWSLRSSSQPPKLSLTALGSGEPFGDLGLTTQSIALYGQRYAVQLFFWTGDNASDTDVQTAAAILQSLTFDEPL
jgi:hypothetical protein